jgi:hypothetical protein
MEDKLVTCNRCKGNACYEVKVEGLLVWKCMGCGFTSNEVMLVGSKLVEETEEVLPELYKDIKFIDDKNQIWYPNVLNIPQLGTVYINGTNIDNWEWVGVRARPTTEEEKTKLKGAEYKSDTSTAKAFGKNGFMDACEYIGLFNQ